MAMKCEAVEPRGTKAAMELRAVGAVGVQRRPGLSVVYPTHRSSGPFDVFGLHSRWLMWLFVVCVGACGPSNKPNPEAGETSAANRDMTEKTQLKVFRDATTGDVAPLRDMIGVQWRVRSVAVVGQTYRVEAFLSVPHPASHTLVIDGALDVGDARGEWRTLQRHPGDSGSGAEKRLMIRDLPVFVGDLLWTIAAEPNGTGTPVTARLRLRFEHVGAGGREAVEVALEHQVVVRSLSTWPDDYPEVVKPTWSDVPLRLVGRVDDVGQAWLDIDLLRALELAVAWEVEILGPDGALIKRVDWAVAAGLAQGISTPITVPGGTEAVVVRLLPSRRVARSEAAIERFADFEFRRTVPLTR
jgi:hypothetical protein